jgi:diadenylate cyclase
MNLFELIKKIGVSGLLDIVVMSAIIYSALVLFKRTRAIFVVIGMFIVGFAYFFARLIDLPLTKMVFQSFFTIFLVAIVVIFQEEIKHFFEQIAGRSFLRNIRGNVTGRLQPEMVESLVRALWALAREKIGALVVIRGKDPIIRHLDGGFDLNGELSEPLIRSIFDPHSPGHDGAMIIRGNQISQFACHLPLSRDLRKTQATGTRHAAALGLSELTDAFCLVVSEERGSITLARNGELHLIADAEDLSNEIESFYREIAPQKAMRPWADFITRNYIEKIVALLITCAMWFFLVHESELEYRTYHVPVAYGTPSRGYAVSVVDPAEVDVTFSGSRRAFYFVDVRNLSLNLARFKSRPGIQVQRVSQSNIVAPQNLKIESVHPEAISLTVEAVVK